MSEVKQLTKSVKDELESSFNDDYNEGNKSDDTFTEKDVEYHKMYKRFVKIIIKILGMCFFTTLYLA